MRSFLRAVAVALTAFASLAACVHGPAKNAVRHGSSMQLPGGVTVSLQARQVRYTGELTAAGLAAVKSLSEGVRVDDLVITSSGGEINVGMDFGEWVLARGLNVVVEEYCLSSCANYVFTAGWQKHVRPGAVVAWHGSARQSDLPDQLVRVVDDQVKALALEGQALDQERHRRQRAVSEYLARSIERQDAFFQRIGVSEYITRVGKERYGLTGFYSLSVADMRHFGIQNVLAQSDQDGVDETAVQEKLDMRIVRLKLDESRP